MATHRLMLEDPPDARFDASASSPARQSACSRLEDLESPSCGLVPDGRSGHVYNEEAFRYFLECERRRSELSMRPFLLLVIDLKRQAGKDKDMRVDSATAQKLFAALALCVRETDFIGWYHEGRVAGAVLTQHADVVVADLPDAVSQRLTKALSDSLPSHVARRLQVRIFQLPGSQRDRS
jgi:hypothetical protein